MLLLIRRFLSSLLILISLGMLVWGMWPVKQQEMEQYLLPDEMRLISQGQASSPALLEARRVRLEWPKSMRIGDDYELNLGFEPVTTEILTPPPQTELSDAYTRYNLMVEVRIESAGIVVRPSDPRRESMPAGQAIQQTWEVNIDQEGSFNGNVWLSLRFLPLDGEQAVQIPIFIHEVDLQAYSLLGLNGAMARAMGGAGIILGSALSYDILIGLGIWITRKRH